MDKSGNYLSRLIKWEKEILPIGEKHIEKVCRDFVIPLRVEKKAKRLIPIASHFILQNIKDVAEACILLALVDLNEEGCLNKYRPTFNQVLCRQIITLEEVSGFFEKPPSVLLASIEDLLKRETPLIISTDRLEVLGVYIRGKSISIRVPEKVKKYVLQTKIIPLDPSKTIFIDLKVLTLIRFTLSKQRERIEPKIPEYIEHGDLLKFGNVKWPINTNELADKILDIEARLIRGHSSYEHYNEKQRKILELYQILDRYVINSQKKEKQIWSSIIMPNLLNFLNATKKKKLI